MHLRSRKLGVRDYVKRLEAAIIDALHGLGVRSFSQPKMPGVWTGPSEKIASIGVRIRRGVSFHGFSLNVNVCEDPGSLIVSCGMPQVRMVNLADLLGSSVEMHAVRMAVARSFAGVFDVKLIPCSLPDAM